MASLAWKLQHPRHDATPLDDEKPHLHTRPSHRLIFLQGARRITILLGIATAASWLIFGWRTKWLGPGFSPRCPRPDSFLTDKPFRWTDLQSFEDIRWVTCFDGFECARLEVPLDWTAPEEEPRRVAIALTKLTSKVPESSEDWKGPLLLNPGGPGGSGVGFVLETAQAFQNLLGDDFSIIGFDPRGVNNTQPVTNCFPVSTERSLWEARAFSRTLNTLSGGEEIGEAYARSISLGSVCAPLVAGSGENQGAEYVNTPAVARDMLAITEAAWAAAGHDHADKGLKYWGFSYGSALGMAFASMFPDRVDRVVVDGVVDAHDYFDGYWSKNLVDTDKVVDSFFTYCSLAGASNCPFHGGEPPSTIKAHFNNLLEKLRTQPLPVENSADIITNSDIVMLAFVSMYRPINDFPILAKTLNAVERGDGAAAFVLRLDPVSCECSGDFPSPPKTGVEADSAIVCTDALPSTNNLTLSEFKTYLSFLKTQNEMAAGSWARIRMACVGWKVQSKGLQFRGPYGGKTKGKVLFVGNTADPVTPLQNARNMRDRFEGAGLVTVDAIGHCSWAAPSGCFAGVVKKYFREGEMPEEGLVCPVEQRPWNVSLGISSPVVTAEEERLRGLARDVSRVWRPVMLGGRL